MTIATMQTSLGTIELELFDADAPKTVANFVELTTKGYYDGLTFHRIIPDFMIQGSQFFIVTTEAAPWLDGRHTVFGKVTTGMDTVDAIEGVDTGANDRPRTPVTMDKVTISA
jgi:cyclophilin family peptidyl-prolyl cis-trans isomerase